MKQSIISQQLGGKKRLYHFTCAARIPSIIHQGIDRGAVAVTPLHAINFPWLTTDPDPASLVEIMEPLDEDGQAMLPAHLLKTGMRLEIELDADDPKLTMWQPYAERLRVRKGFYEFFTHRPQFGMEWYVYRGVIGFEKVISAFHPATGEMIASEELKVRYSAGAQVAEPWRAPVVWMSEAQALTLTQQDFDIGEDPTLIEVLMHSQFPPQSIETLRVYARTVKTMFEIANRAS